MSTVFLLSHITYDLFFPISYLPRQGVSYLFPPREDGYQLKIP